MRKILFWMGVGLIWGFWPYSIIKSPPKLSTETIFYTDGEENRLFLEKLGLDTSPIKRFYYNKTTLVTERYVKNVLVMLDVNNYFFAMHPREDVSGVDYRVKYPWVAVICLIVASFGRLRIGRLGVILVMIMGLAGLRWVDGWDFILWLPISLILGRGWRKICDI